MRYAMFARMVDGKHHHHVVRARGIKEARSKMNKWLRSMGVKSKDVAAANGYGENDKFRYSLMLAFRLTQAYRSAQLAKT